MSYQDPDLRARVVLLEEALRAAASVCETLPGKIIAANDEGALTEIEWLADIARAALAGVAP